MHRSLIAFAGSALMLGAAATPAAAQSPLHVATLQKLETAAGICEGANGQPPEAFARLAVQAGFTENAARGWWQWNSGIVGPSMIVTRQPERCRIVLIPDGLTRDQVAEAVLAWADGTGFEADREPASGEPDVSLVTGLKGRLGLNLWASAQGNFLIDFDPL